MNYELHPLCTLFPRITGAEFDALVADIKANGLREPIIVHEGMILDGGNRYRACIEAGVTPSTMKFGGGNLVDYVLSANLHRRHLLPMQTAAIVASLTNWSKSHAHGGDRKSNQAAHLPLDTVADRAAVSGVSDKTQRNADKIAKADPDLAKALGRGEVSPSDAVEKVTGKRPGVKPAAQPEASPADDETSIRIDMLNGALEALNEENESLRNQIATMLFTGTDEEKAEHLDRLNTLTEANKQLEILNHGLVAARDRFMRENVSLRKQGEYAAKKLKAIDRAAA